MARLWTCGFELQSTTAGMEWETNVNSVNWTGSVKRSGAASLLLAPVAGTGAVRMPLTASSFATTTLYARAYIYVATMPGGLTSIIRFTNGATNRMEVRLNSNGTLELWNSTAQVGSDSSALSTNTWYRIELKVVINGSFVGTDIEAKIDGTAFASGASQSIGAIDAFSVGVFTSATTTIYFDDLAVNDSSGSYQTGYPGEGSVVVLTPNGAGASSQWRPFTGSNYDNVNDIPPNDITDYVDTQARNANDVDEYTLSDTPAAMNSGDLVNVVHAGVRFARSSTNTSDTFQVFFTANSGTTYSATIQPNTSTWRTNAIATPRLYPITEYGTPGNNATALTKSHLDAAVAGLKAITTSNSNDALVSALWIMVEYAPTGNTTTTKTITGVARIQATTTRTQSGVARLQKSVTQTISGVAKLVATVARTVVGLTRIQRTGATFLNESMASSPSTGTLRNSAVWNAGGYLKLTSPTNFDTGQIEWSGKLPNDCIVEFEFWSGGGNGADSVYFYRDAAATVTAEDVAQSGTVVYFSEYLDRIGVTGDYFSGGFTTFDNSTWHTVRIIFANGTSNIIVDGAANGATSYTITNGGSLYGFGGRTGGLNNEHRIRNLRIYSNYREINGLARIQKTVAQTIAGIADIRNTTTRTITGVAKIGSGNTTATKTQTGISRLLKSVTQTIAGLSRVQKTVAQVQTGVARIRATATRTQVGLSRITALAARTIIGTARLQKSVAVTQAGLARIRVTVARTQAGVANIRNSTLRTITGISKITATTTRTIVGLARITATTARTIPGVSRISISVQRTITAVSRITISTTRTIVGLARITASTTRTQGGLARIRKTVTQTITGVSSLVTTTTRAILGVSAIRKTTTRTIAGLSRLQVTVGRTVAGVARITATTSRTIVGFSRVQKAVTQTIAGLSRIGLVTSRTILGVARITATATRTITGLSAIRKTTTQTITGISNINGSIQKLIIGVAAIRNTITRTQSGLARIRRTVAQTITGISRLSISTARTVVGVARITVSTVRTIPGVARIQNTTLRTITGVSRLTQHTSRTILGIARITISSVRTIVGVSRIGLNQNRTIVGRSRITVTVLRTVLGMARLTRTGVGTIVGLASVQRSVTKLITGISRVQTSVGRTIAGISRLIGKTQQTITGKAAITRTTTQNITGVASIVEFVGTRVLIDVDLSGPISLVAQLADNTAILVEVEDASIDVLMQ
jgi:hypothetical protein